MPTQIVSLRSLLTYLLMLAALGANCAIAETTVDYGTVTAIDIYRTSDHSPVNPGTVVGGIAGGVIGHQIGSGRGNTAATIVGALGGAAIGNEVDKNRTQASRYRISVKLDSGSLLVVEDTRDPNLRVGDRVRVEDNRLYRL